MRRTQRWLVCYDVRDPKRLVRVHRRIREDATPVQYSVFLFEGAPAVLGRLLGDIGSIINEREDDVRAYCLPDDPATECLGRRPAPEGVTWLARAFLPGRVAD